MFLKYVQQAKISTGTYKENSIKKMLNYYVENPCRHFILGPILANYIKSPKDCVIPKVSEQYLIIKYL